MQKCEDLSSKKDIREAVRDGYGKIARQGTSCCCASSCCSGPSPESLAIAIGYNEKDLAGIPEGANLGLSCGNPTSIASLQPGEILLDLGSGAGFDVFIAAARVGSTGRVIGVDMTSDMLAKARENAERFKKRTDLDNVEFRLGEIEHLPVADCSVDVVISNCVINLSTDKARVWREIGRVLKPGGRVAVSDLALLRPLPEKVRASLDALVGCIAGAVLVDETREMIREAGLVDAVLNPKAEYIQQMSEWADPLYQEISENLPAGMTLVDFVTSLNIEARKPLHQRV